MWWYDPSSNPKPSQVTYPDGTNGSRPFDGEKFKTAKQTYTWDDVLGRWSDEKGELLPENQSSDVSKANGCVCGSWVSGEYTRHSKYCSKYLPDDMIKVPFDKWRKE